MTTNAYYDPGPERAAKVNRLFLSIARRYDRLNDLQSFGLHRCWKRRVAELAGIAPGQTALDLCCGTGDLAFVLAARGAEVTALDASEGMLEVASERLRRWTAPAGSGRVRFVRGDAQQPDFPSGSFDAVTVGYGLRNLESWETGLREMVRVAKPGGRVVVLDFGKPPNAAWRALYFTYLRMVVPVLGLLFSGDAGAYAYILESLRYYPAQEVVAARMGELGLVDVGLVNFVGGAMSIQYGRRDPRVLKNGR